MSRKLRVRSGRVEESVALEDIEEVPHKASGPTNPKVIILGTHYSGKTTLFKQFGSPDKRLAEQEKWRTVVVDNILVGLKSLCENVTKLFSEAGEQRSVYDRLRAFEANSMWDGSQQEVLERFAFLKRVWEDKGI